MAPRKPKPQAAQEVSFAPSKISKAKAQKPDKTTKSRSGRSNKEPEPYRVKRYRNGLLNLEKTPPHLEAIVKRNASDSPLLRLPPEIRNIIWHFTLSNELVQLPLSKRLKGGAVRYTRDRDVDINTVFPENVFRVREPETMAAGFHLPEVCRQIYSETALVAYSQSTFTFGSGYRSYSHGVQRLKQVQIRAITSIEPDPFIFNTRIQDIFWIWSGDTISPAFKPFRALFPNLSKLIIGRLTLELFKVIFKGYASAISNPNMPHEDHKAIITQAVQQKEGSGVEVVFKDPDPSW